MIDGISDEKKTKISRSDQFESLMRNEAEVEDKFTLVLTCWHHGLYSLTKREYRTCCN